MMRGLSDTDPETARVHVDLLRRASPRQRLRLAFSLSRTVLSLSRDTLARSQPGSSPQEIALRFVALHYGPHLADEVRADLAARRR